MIQRIQSIYLLLVAIAGIFMFIYPFVSLVPDGSSADPAIYHLSALKVEILNNGISSVLMLPWPMVLLNTLIISFSCIVIMQYKKRKTQIVFTHLLLLLLIGQIILIGYDVNKISYVAGVGHSVSFTVFTLFPILQIIFTRLATSAIKKDDNLVRSADRLR